MQALLRLEFDISLMIAGGGGYMLGFTDDPEKAARELAGYDILWV